MLKRRIAIKKSLSRPQEAISALVEFLESNATDAEAWCELADLYHSQGMNAQAIFSIEEALLIAPNAWNVRENDLAIWDRILISTASRPYGRN